MSGYNATKFAVRGFTEALRQELDLMRCGVSATSVHPGGVYTNIAQSSRIANNMVGFMIEDEQRGKDDFEKKFFLTTADEAARVILDGVRGNRRRVLIGRDARAGDRLARMLPSAYQTLVVWRMRRRMRRLAEKRARQGAVAGRAT